MPQLKKISTSEAREAIDKIEKFLSENQDLREVFVESLARNFFDAYNLYRADMQRPSPSQNDMRLICRCSGENIVDNFAATFHKKKSVN